jgi:hypothetical protein
MLLNATGYTELRTILFQLPRCAATAIHDIKSLTVGYRRCLAESIQLNTNPRNAE